MTDDRADDDALRDLARDIPWDRPDAARRDAVRSSLLVAAAETRPRRDRRWLVTAATFSAGALAAAAIALVVVRTSRPDTTTSGHPGALASNPAQITTSTAARIEHQVVATPTGVDEIVRVHDGTVRLTVADVRTGDHVRVRTRDAEVEGAGDYEVVVAGDDLSAVSVRSGTAEIRVDGQRSIFLSAGQTWHAAVITADLLGPKPSGAGSSSLSGTGNVTTTSGTSAVASDVRTSTNPPAGSQPEARTNIASDIRTLDGADGASRAGGGGGAADGRTLAGADRASRTGGGGVAADGRTLTGADGARPGVDGARVASDSRTLAGADRRAGAGGVTEMSVDARGRTGSGTGVASEGRTGGAADGGGRTSRDDRAGAATAARMGSGVATASTTATAKSGRAAEIEKRFEQGWKLLREGKAQEAAVELGAAADASPDDALAADARYFQAIALVRAGQGREAEHVLVAFLDHAPKSLRRGRAAVLLGRLIAARGDVESARAWYKSAVDDPDTSVAAAARAGLDALPPRR